MLDVQTPRPKGNRETAYPTEGHKLIANPPLFTWPMADYEFPTTFPPVIHEKDLDDFAKYDFQLGRTRDFSDAESVLHTGLRLAFSTTIRHSSRESGIGVTGCRVRSGPKPIR